MYMGAAEDEGRNADPQVAMSKMELAKAAGFDTIRITAVWTPGESAVPEDQLQALQSIAAAGVFLDIRIVATVMPVGSRTTPLAAAARTQFARFAADMVRRVPTIREYIIGNEPNLNRYWLPQFGPRGEDVAAPAYVQLLARTYDLMKAADRGVFINGGSVVAARNRSSRYRTRHAFADGVHHRHGDCLPGDEAKQADHGRLLVPSRTARTRARRRRSRTNVGTSLGLADYPRLVDLLGKAFNGTKQKGSTLPIVYDEYGVDSQIPVSKRSFYGGKEPATTRPVTEGVQAAYYDEALKLAACQPTVRGFLIFHVTDETDYNRWQSGVYYADGTPKASRALVKRSMADVRSGAYECGEPPVTNETFGWTLISHSN